MCASTSPGTSPAYPKESRDDVVNVALNREPARLKNKSEEVLELRKRNRLLKQENEVLRRAAAHLSQANLPGK